MVDTADTVDTVDTADTVDTVDTADTADTVGGTVGEGGALVGDDHLGVRLEPLQPLQHLTLDPQVLFAPQAIDRLVARNARDPGARVVRHAVGRPALQGDHEGLLHRLLGQVEVAEDADQARDRPPGLVPEGAVDELI